MYLSKDDKVDAVSVSKRMNLKFHHFKLRKIFTKLRRITKATEKQELHNDYWLIH